MKKIVTLLIAVFEFLGAPDCVGAEASLQDADYPRVLYYGFSRVDPDLERIVQDSWVVVLGNKIEEIGSGAHPNTDFAELRDLSGLYALPGLIDAHAHITSGPHAVAIIDGAPLVTIESVDEITMFNARMALAFGITTARNPGGDPVANARYDTNISNGTWIGPETVHAGAVIQPPPFGGNAFAYPKTPQEWRAEAKRQASLGTTYFKLYVSLKEDELAAGIEAAHEYGLKAIAHLNEVSWTRAVELAIDGIEHALPTSPDLLEAAARADYIAGLGPDSKFMYRWFELADFGGPLFQEMLSQLEENQIETNMTLVVNELVYNLDDLSGVWPEEDHQFTHPENLAASQQFIQASAAGWEEEDYARARAVMPKVLEFARILYEAGVPMMIGTDSNGGTPSYAREVALHVEAGIPVWAVLRMATSGAAELLGVSDHTGRIAPGKEADIVFLRSNPLEDVANVRDVAIVLTDGNPYSFDELVGEAMKSIAKSE